MHRVLRTTFSRTPPPRTSRDKSLSRIRSRSYATHHQRPRSLPQSLDHTPNSPPSPEYVGPFQLGLQNNSLRPGETVKKWSELSTRGKVVRTTARTTNLTVIIFGAGLSIVLVYALTSELFSKNSPTVLYGQACEKIKASPEVARYLHGPLAFHNNPPSTTRPRHRNHHVSSQIFVDSAGREHMRLNFFVEGRLPGTSPPSNSYLESMSFWAQDKVSMVSELTLDESIAWAKHLAADTKESLKRLFRYLSGAPLPPPPLQSLPVPDQADTPKKDEGVWSFAGLFSGLRGSQATQVTAEREPSGRIWTDGEVHADLVMNDEGYFVLRYLLIDMPNSRSQNRKRLFVERAPGVPDREPVIRWY